MLGTRSEALSVSLVIALWSSLVGCSELPDVPATVDAALSVEASDGAVDSAGPAVSSDRGVVLSRDGGGYDLGDPDVGVDADGSTGEDGRVNGRDLGQLPIDPDAQATPPPAPPSFDYLDTVLDLAVPGERIWAHVSYVDRQLFLPRLVHQSYRDTGGASGFWPASTIKMFTATAALVLLNDLEVSIDATATFYRETNGRWVEDITLSFRELIHRTFNCSSNETYTLLLRFAGLDWLNGEFFVAANGFEGTALMRGYVAADARPYAFLSGEAQRIVVRDQDRESVREHRWSGRSYANERGCTVYNEAGTGNCTTPRDMAEHLRRLILHEEIPLAERFAIDEDSLAWYRGAGPERVLNNTGGDACGGPAYAGVLRVFPRPNYHHKGGTVREYRATIQHVQDPESGTQYTAAIAIQNGSSRPIEKASEEIARMTKTPGLYVHLDSLRDNVNPIRADLVVIADEPGRIELVTKAYGEDGYSEEGWVSLGSAESELGAGETAHSLRSVCLDRSERVHIRGRLRTDSGRVAWSDLHYVIVDHTQPCENP